MKNRYLLFIFSVLFDLCSAASAFILSFFVVGDSHLISSQPMFVFSLFVWPAILVVCHYVFKIYVIMWRFTQIADLARIFLSMVLALSATFISQMAVFNKTYPMDIVFVTFFIALLLSVAYRIILRKIMLNEHEKAKNKTSKEIFTELTGNIMIIGGGSAASMLINDLKDNNRLKKNCKIKCIIDDDPIKKGSYISGIPVVGGRETIIATAEKMNINTILFAIPSCSSNQKFEILNICQQTGCALRIVPSMYQLMEEKEKGIVNKIRNVEIEDLLGRDPISFNVDEVMSYVTDKVVMVTGGGGTIGSELCRQIALHRPGRLIIFDIYENNAYDIQNELKRKYPELELITLIGSVRDSKRIENVFRLYRPDIVYHAAAHKHVPLMEDSPNESVKNNVFGTLKTVQCADKYGVQKFVLISTDKAVNPTNIMGASKRICEMIVQSFNAHSKTEFVAVRFGNVLGSNGSVIPLFKKQIEAGGPVTVTDPNIIRYFMTISEAVTLVLQAGALAKGGEIFVLDMGKPVKILTLAENLIKLSGLVPYKDINIEFIGLRPGEKLYEEMLMAEEGLTDTENGMIHIGKPIEYNEDEFFNALDDMKQCMYDDSVDIRAIVKSIVPTYNYSK